MSGKPTEPPPSYYAADPQAPKPSYNGGQYPPQGGPQGDQFGGYPPQGAGGGYYQQQNMGYYGQPQGPYQQGPYQQGPYGPQGPYGQQPYGPPQGYYQQDPRRGNGAGTGIMEGLLAALCCCCCLDILI